jgi:hypothetical protein
MSAVILDLQTFPLQQTGYEFVDNAKLKQSVRRKAHNTCLCDKLQILLPGLAISESFRAHLPANSCISRLVNRKHDEIFRSVPNELCSDMRKESLRRNYGGTGPIFIVVQHEAHRCPHCSDFFSISFIIGFLWLSLMACIKY